MLIQEVSQRDTPKTCNAYEHIQPEGIGEIWAEDFTQLAVNGIRFKVALLIDAFDQYILGCSVSRRATEALVAVPVQQALKANGGRPPAKFLLEDNGTQYVSESHQQLLKAYEIVSRNIPPAHLSITGLSSAPARSSRTSFIMYGNVLRKTAWIKKKSLDERVKRAVEDTVHLDNFQIPRPALGGVTPADVHFGLQLKSQVLFVWILRSCSSSNFCCTSVNAGTQFMEQLIVDAPHVFPVSFFKRPFHAASPVYLLAEFIAYTFSFQQMGLACSNGIK